MLSEQALTCEVRPIFIALSAMGADGVARALRRELQRSGVTRVPRGERQSTRRNPAGLTARQAEVFSLMQEGLSNAAIAERLYISEKTAGHHVSAILAKLNVRSRLQAVAMATTEGWVETQL